LIQVKSHKIDNGVEASLLAQSATRFVQPHRCCRGCH